MTKSILTVMRLKDMARVHPEQIESKCARCGYVVGIYPSGQRMLAFFGDDIEIVCQACYQPGHGSILAPGAEIEPFESKRKQ